MEKRTSLPRQAQAWRLGLPAAADVGLMDQAVASGMRQGDKDDTAMTGNNRGKARRSNWRTALVLLSIALVFFIGVIANRLLFG